VVRTVAALLVAATLALGAPAVAGAQGDPFSPLPPAPREQLPPPRSPTTQSPDGGGLQSWQQLLILASALVLIGGIAFAIVSDAKRSAPVREPADDGEPEPSAREKVRRQQRSREKAKAARRQRKRNRAR
jgi:hypothetical protein